MTHLEKALCFLTPLFIAQAFNIGFITLGKVLNAEPGILSSTITFVLFFLIADRLVQKQIIAKYKKHESSDS